MSHTKVIGETTFHYDSDLNGVIVISNSNGEFLVKTDDVIGFVDEQKGKELISKTEQSISSIESYSEVIKVLEDSINGDKIILPALHLKLRKGNYSSDLPCVIKRKERRVYIIEKTIEIINAFSL